MRSRYLFARFGWKLVLGVFLYYLIRDVVLYIFLPYLALRFAW